jgi:hypothetical protein
MSNRKSYFIIAMIWIAAALITAPWLVVFQQRSIGQDKNDDFLVTT